jgi:EAL domain-containing protein (putative c-di-GMP-specific phosphodiesterase class I)
VRGERLFVSCSIGVASTSEPDAVDVLAAANTALSRAKARGRARIEVHTGGMDAAAADQLSLATDLRLALDRDELELHYQPIVRLDTGHPVGVEALLRWEHPTRGPLSPETFIPLAEEAGLMPRLGAWSLRRACQEGAQCTDRSDGAWHLAVNLSARQLVNENFPRLVQDVLDESGFPAGRLVLEVTESAVLSDSEQVIETLAALRALGVRVAIDDFGTGYSSFTYLKQFPVDVLKIDRSFVSRLTIDEDDRAIVASLVSLAAAVGIEAVAEGVETVEQADALRALGCPLAQGFLWSAAVSSGDLAAVLKELRSRPNAPSTSPRDAGSPRKGGAGRMHWTLPDEATCARIIALHRAGASLDTIAAALNADGLLTATGRRWHRSSVARVVAQRQFPDERFAVRRSADG